MSRYDKVFLLLCSIFVACLIIANALMFKFVDIPMPFMPNGHVTVSIGILPYPITFLVTDVISEIYGKQRANYLVYVGFVVSLMFLGFILIGRVLPVSQVQDPVIQEHFMAVFGMGIRAISASMIAYLVAQALDVRLFHLIRKVTDGKHLWLRNNGSTLISQFVDTTLIIFILFWDKPGMNLWHLIFSGYLFKLFVALADTPFCYISCYLLKDFEKQTLAENGYA